MTKLAVLRNVQTIDYSKNSHEKHVTVVRAHAEGTVDNVGRIVRCTRNYFAAANTHATDLASKREFLCDGLNDSFHVILYVHVVLFDEFINLLNESIAVRAKHL